MTEEAKYKKEIQNRKKQFDNKKVELISKLCVDEVKQKREEKLDT